jgi:hypothetical protein
MPPLTCITTKCDFAVSHFSAMKSRPIAQSRRLSQKGKVFEGWRRGGRTVVKSHEIASQNLFSIPSSQNFAYPRVLSGENDDLAYEFGRCNSNSVPMRNLGNIVASLRRQRLLSPHKGRSRPPTRFDPKQPFDISA